LDRRQQCPTIWFGVIEGKSMLDGRTPQQQRDVTAVLVTRVTLFLVLFIVGAALSLAVGLPILMFLILIVGCSIGDCSSL
jgi:hypothetical protein